MPTYDFGPNSICGRVWRAAHELPDTDETVLFDEAENQLLVLSSTGAAVWHLLDGQRTLGQIAAFIGELMPAAPTSVEAEVIDFAHVLAARGAIEELPRAD